MTKERQQQVGITEAQKLFLDGCERWEVGELRSALTLFLRAAKRGDTGAQINVGLFYDKGIGIKPNKVSALYWYKRAYRRGDAGGANNIATIWLDRGQGRRALAWFKKAVLLGDEGANLNIAKYYIEEGHENEAIKYLTKVRKSRNIAETEIEEAVRLLRSLKRGRWRTRIHTIRSAN